MNITPLEALKDLTKLLNTNDYLSLYSMCDLHTIEKALKDYEELKGKMGITDVVKEDFVQLWKEHKALEIIKEKNVDVIYLRYECNCLEDYNENNQTCDLDKNEYLTQEEYDLLTEVLA